MLQTDAGHTPAILRIVEERSRASVWVSIVTLVVGLCWIDIVTGWEMSFSIFYLIPVALGSWRGGAHAAIALGVLSAIAWFSADQLAGHVYSRDWIPYWNAGVRLGMFLILGLTLAALKSTLRRANELARVDALTGVANLRAFQEQLSYHVDFATRSRDYLTVAALDLDHFKTVNDTHGHAAGDRALVGVAGALSASVRRVDVVARVGGDEFVLLLPRTDEPGAAHALEKVRAAIQQEMCDNGWPITASIGAVTCRGRLTPDHLMRTADGVLYRAKAEGGNRVLIEQPGLVLAGMPSQGGNRPQDAAL